jgi:hypothetical protein
MLPSITKNSLKFFLISRLLDFTILLAGMLLSGISASAQIVPLNQEPAVFELAPRLVKLSTNLSQTRASGAKHRFTIAVPQNAGASLKAITITQPESGDRIDYEANQSKAFAGESNPQGTSSRIAQKTEIPLASIGGPQLPDGEVTVVFNRPVLPGQAVTVELSPRTNPSRDGVYLFGITAYPEGQNGPGLFLGHSRLTFYGPR